MDEKYLKQANIFELRNIAREVGVLSPTKLKKEDLILHVLKILSGEEKPKLPKNRQGRPTKSVFQRTLVSYKEENTTKFHNMFENNEFNKVDNLYSSEILREKFDTLANKFVSYREEIENLDDSEILKKQGYFKKMDNEFGILHDIGRQKVMEEILFIPNSYINYFNLKTGDYIECKLKKNSPINASIIGIEKLDKRDNFLDINFDDQDIVCANNDTEKQQIKLENLTFDASTRNILKITSFKNLSNHIKNFQDLQDYNIVILTLDALPEDLLNFKHTNLIENFYTLLGDSSSQAIATLETTIERVKRLAEKGKKVIFVVNEAKKIIKHSNFLMGYSHEEIKSKSLDLCNKILVLARKLKQGGEVSVFMFFKSSSNNETFEKALLSEFETMNCNIFNLD